MEHRFPARLLFSRICIGLFIAAALSGNLSMSAEENVIPITNGGFEEDFLGWTLNEGDVKISAVSLEKAFSGEKSLHILDRSTECGSSVAATRVAFSGPGIVDIRGRFFPVSGNGLGVYVRQYNKAGENISGESHIAGLGGTDRKWLEFSRRIYVSDATTHLELLFHSYNKATVEAYLDDLHFVKQSGAIAPPWEGSYKIRPHESERLTAADVVGPDGIVYPDWTRCGVQGGIPAVPAVVHISEFGGIPDDEVDDADALDQACKAVGEKGGGAISLAEGVYCLDRPVTVNADGVVIRGAGREKTKLLFRYALQGSGIRFYSPHSGARIGANTPIEVHALPTGLQSIDFTIDGARFQSWRRSLHSGNTFSARRKLGSFLDKLEDGPSELETIAIYADGQERRCTIPVIVDRTHPDAVSMPSSSGALTFGAAGMTGEKLLLKEDGVRGATVITLEDPPADLSAGDRLYIEGPATERWKKLTQNACRWGRYRCYAVTVAGIDGNRVTLDQPLRITFPVIDGSFVRKLSTIERCGVEDLTIEQTENLWISSILFRYGWNCWARGVRVVKCGQFPVYGKTAKFCEIRDCVFDDAWFKGGGGTAYAGWDFCWDCLTDNLETFNLRHAPCFQWAASGCVIRNSVFHNSDAQWHSGWTNENLMENCVITSCRGNGGYGFGMWASPPEDTAHGPNGPRNVVYNCDITSEKTGLWMGGMNENWLILYNRFVVEKGNGVFAKSASFDHIVKGNVFVLKDGSSGMVYLATPDCIGVEITDNVLVGGGGDYAVGAGAVKARLRGNRLAAPNSNAGVSRPLPDIESIFDWQRANR